MSILVTGSSGLIGTALRARLAARGEPVIGLDLRGDGAERGDTRDRESVARAIRGVRGVVHLAAVSRVIDGERDPDACVATNLGGTRNVLELAPADAWIVFASSREVYGRAAHLPAPESTPLAPMNIYGRTKVDGEKLVAGSGRAAAIVRLSNVYGSPRDHVDRVVPAFARGAIEGRPLRVDGPGHTFDFVYLDDAIDGILAIIDALDRRERLPPLHLVTGRPTTLGELASLAIELTGSSSPIVEAPPRDYDVERFFGDGTLARERLGWYARVPLRDGLARLISALRVS